MHCDVQMPASYPLANDLAEARLERFETFGHAQMQIEKAVIHAANSHAQAPAVFRGSGLSVTGHGFQAALGGCRRSGRNRFWTCTRHIYTGPAALLTVSTSRNCISYKRAYTPPRARSSSCVPRSRIVPPSSTAIKSARRIVERR